MSKITIYENFSRINEEIKDSNEIYNVDGEDPRGVFVVDSMGNLLDYKYKSRPVNPFLNGMNAGSKDVVTVTKGSKNFTGNLLNYEKDKVVIKTGNKAVLVHDYDTVEFMSVPNLSSTIQIKERNNNSYPYRLIYETDKIKWRYEGIGLISKGENGIYNINLTIMAHIYNTKDAKEYDVTLASALNKEAFHLNIGKRMLEKRVNAITIKETNVVAKKVYYYDYMKNETLLGFRIKEMAHLPKLNISFYEYQGAGNLGVLYGVAEVGGSDNLKLVDVKIRKAEGLIISNIVKEVSKTKTRVEFTAKNTNDEKINLLSTFKIPENKKFEKITCDEPTADYNSIKNDHIEWQTEIYPNSEIQRNCVISFF